MQRQNRLVDKEIHLLCQYCNQQDYTHIDKEQKDGVWRQKLDANGNLFRKTCGAEIDARLAKLYSPNMILNDAPEPETTELWTKLLKVTDGKAKRPYFANALITGEMKEFYPQFKRCLRSLNTKPGNLWRPVIFPFTDRVHIPRLKAIQFEKDGEFKTYESLMAFDLMIVDLSIATNESSLDAPFFAEFLAMRKHLVTWFVVPRMRHNNLNNNIPQDIQEFILGSFSRVNLGKVAVQSETLPRPLEVSGKSLPERDDSGKDDKKLTELEKRQLAAANMAKGFR